MNLKNTAKPANFAYKIKPNGSNNVIRIHRSEVHKCKITERKKKKKPNHKLRDQSFHQIERAEIKWRFIGFVIRLESRIFSEKRRKQKDYVPNSRFTRCSSTFSSDLSATRNPCVLINTLLPMFYGEYPRAISVFNCQQNKSPIYHTLKFRNSKKNLINRLVP